MKHKKRKFAVTILFALFVVFVNNCSNTLVEDIKRGTDYNYQPSYPELRLEVSEHIDENNQTYLTVIGEVVENSLIFKKNGDSLSANIHIDIELFNHRIDEVSQMKFPISLGRQIEDDVFGESIFEFVREIETPPGKYDITVSVIDLSSQKATVREAEAYLPDPENDVSNITNISILTKKSMDDDYSYTSTYDVGLDVDSVKFQFQVTNNDPEKPLTIQSRLIRFDADTSAAQPMSFSNVSRSSIRYKGIEYDDYDVIQTSTRDFDQPGNVLIEYVFTDLKRGNYRFEVARNLDDRSELYKGRDFGMKSKNYPAIKSARELARPLIYLMNEKEYENLMDIKAEDSLKKAIDRFWLENLQNSAMAKNVISLFYQRVEEANKYFSNFKEGWKTDLGMIYILFGAPLDEYKRLRNLRWSYRFNLEDPDYTFYFRAPKNKTEHFPFNNYILQRDSRYFNIEYRQRLLWLSGSILRDNI